MPDEKIEETLEENAEVQDQEEIDDQKEEESAFDEATSEKPEEPEPEVKAEKVDKSTTPEGEETPKDEDKEDKEEKEEEDEAKTAREIADERAEKLLKGDDEEAEDPPTPPPVTPPEEKASPPEVKAAPSSITKETIAQFLGAISDDDLPDGEIIIGNQSVNLREYKDDYPDEYSAMMVLAGTLAQKAVNEALGKSTYANSDDLQRVHQEYQDEIRDLRFWQQVSIDHSDALKVAQSDSFDTWVKKQSRGIQALAGSMDPEDAVSVLDLYKEEQAKSNVAEFDKKARAEKKKKDALHKGTLKTGTQTKKAEGGGDEDDEQAGFDLFYKKKQQQNY